MALLSIPIVQMSIRATVFTEISLCSQFHLNCAGENQGDKLGLYHLTTDPREESSRRGLVYKQFHCGQDVKKIHYYLYRWELLKGAKKLFSFLVKKIKNQILY